MADKEQQSQVSEQDAQNAKDPNHPAHPEHPHVSPPWSLFRMNVTLADHDSTANGSRMLARSLATLRFLELAPLQAQTQSRVLWDSDVHYHGRAFWKVSYNSLVLSCASIEQALRTKMQQGIHLYKKTPAS
jgi:hypothetical protein